MNSIKEKSKYNFYSKKNDLEIIKKYQDLLVYVFNLTKKYPKNDELSLVFEIKNKLLKGLEYLIISKNSLEKAQKANNLLNVQANLDILIILIRLSLKNKYITKNNYTAWSFKISSINNDVMKWIKSCQKP